MNYMGISCGFHDASIAVVNEDGDVTFFARSADYTGVSGDPQLNTKIIEDALRVAGDEYEVHYYEQPLLKYLRQLRSGESTGIKNALASHMIGREYHKLLGNKKIHTYRHHLTHAAAGFQTSDYQDATVVVIDAIGEWDTVTIWDARYEHGIAQYRRLWTQNYPDSIGLFYSAMTDALGMTSVKDEYLLMKLSETGDRHGPCVDLLLENIIDSIEQCTFKSNLHCGLDSEIRAQLLSYSDADIAAATQVITERLIDSVMLRAHNIGWSDNLVYTGGVAMNGLANKNLGNHFTGWTVPRWCGDAGSSIGACALAHGGKITYNIEKL